RSLSSSGSPGARARSPIRARASSAFAPSRVQNRGRRFSTRTPSRACAATSAASEQARSGHAFNTSSKATSRFDPRRHGRLDILTELPAAIRWLFWEFDVEQLDTGRDADTILARVLEHGRMADVRWAIATYGFDRIHRFFRDVGRPELSDRTLQFWRAVFRA